MSRIQPLPPPRTTVAKLLTRLKEPFGPFGARFSDEDVDLYKGNILVVRGSGYLKLLDWDLFDRVTKFELLDPAPQLVDPIVGFPVGNLLGVRICSRKPLWKTYLGWIERTGGAMGPDRTNPSSRRTPSDEGLDGDLNRSDHHEFRSQPATEDDFLKEWRR